MNQAKPACRLNTYRVNAEPDSRYSLFGINFEYNPAERERFEGLMSCFVDYHSDAIPKLNEIAEIIVNDGIPLWARILCFINHVERNGIKKDSSRSVYDMFLDESKALNIPDELRYEENVQKTDIIYGQIEQIAKALVPDRKIVIESIQFIGWDISQYNPNDGESMQPKFIVKYDIY